MAISMNDIDEETTDEQELIKRLTQGKGILLFATFTYIL